MLTQRNVVFILVGSLVFGYWLSLVFQVEAIEPTDLFEGLRMLALDD